MREGKQATVGPSRLWLRSADRGVGVEASAARAPPWRSGRTVGCVQDEPCWAPLHARNTATSCGVGVICCATRLCDLCGLAEGLVLNGAHHRMGGADGKVQQHGVDVLFTGFGGSTFRVMN